MLQKKQIMTHIKTNFLPSVIKRIPQDYDPAHGLLTLTVKVDLMKTFRQASHIASFIVGSFSQFYEIVEESVLEMMQETNLRPPAFGLNISFHIINCSLPRHNLESIQFMSVIFEQENGVLVFLKDCHISEVGQPELYLSRWTEVWSCNCNGVAKKQKFNKKQSLVQIVKKRSQSLKDRIYLEIPRCSQCDSKMKQISKQDYVFVNCQKIKVTTSMKFDTTKDEIFQKGELYLYLDQSHTSTLNKGDNVDFCVYYSAEPSISKIVGNQIQLKVQRSGLVVSWYPISQFSSVHNVFFSKLSNLSYEYINCDNPRDEETIFYNYNSMLKTVNQINFPYIEQNYLSTMKMALLNSLFNQMYSNSLHVMLITEEVSYFQKAIKLQGVSIKQWPTQYDQQTLLNFLMHCHNSIVLITNPKKKDFEYINEILDKVLIKNTNFTLWIIAQPSKQYKKELQLQKIHIVMDLSMEKNLNICKNVFDGLIDLRLDSFVNKEEDYFQTVLKQKKETFVDEHVSQFFSGLDQTGQEVQKEQRLAQEIIQQYFIKAREYKHMNSNELQIINQIALGFSYMRDFIKEKGSIPKVKPSLNVLHAILAIFMSEQSSRNRYSSSNTLFSNQVSKLMLNEQDCQLSLWDYDYDENDDMGESRKMVSREAMFKHMVGKFMKLIFENELF